MAAVMLACCFVGAGRVVIVDIETSQLVRVLKEVIAGKLKYTCPAYTLQFFLAKKMDGTWLSSKDPDFITMRSGAIPEKVKEMLNEEIDSAKKKNGDLFDGAPTKKTIHVLVKVPKTSGEPTRPDEWFVDDALSVETKKRRVLGEDNGDHRPLTYFKMSGFPPLAHPMKKYATIMERDSSIVISRELMGKVKEALS